MSLEQGPESCCYDQTLHTLLNLAFTSASGPRAHFDGVEFSFLPWREGTYEQSRMEKHFFGVGQLSWGANANIRVKIK
jgi:hypothetical protein